MMLDPQPPRRAGDSSPPPLVEARDLSVVHGTRTLLDHVTLGLRQGEIVTIIGPNGAGKTTLLRALMGLERPTAGAVWRRPGLTVGYLPQKVHIDPVLPLPVSRLLTLSRPADKGAVWAALDAVGASRLVDAQAHTLSGGELQRVLLARAILRRPDILFLDEPTQGVDVAGEVELYDLIAGLRRSLGCAVAMVSHDLHVVMAAADRVVCLHHHVCCAGRPETVSRHPEYRRLFGERAATRLAVYAHAHDHHHLPDGVVVPDAEAPATGACCGDTGATRGGRATGGVGP